MPKVIGLVIGAALIATGIGAAAGLTIFSIDLAAMSGLAIASVIVSGATMVLGGVVGLLTRPPSMSNLLSDIANNSVTVRQPAAAREIVYGRAFKAGVLSYLATTGTNSEFLHMVITFAGHQAKAIDAIFFDTYQLVLDGSGNETSKYAGGFCSVEQKLGAPGEAAFPGLITDTSGLGAGAWTSNHRQDGCVSVHVKLKWDANKFPNGAPQAIKLQLRGKLVTDPRTGVTDYSENVACQVRDYLMDTRFGLRAPASEINDTTFIAAANLADEAVPLLAGGSEPRYAGNGNTDASKMPGDILKAMLSAGAGKLVWVGGQWCVVLGGWRAPAFSFNDDDYRAGLQVTGRTARRDLYNGVKGLFVNPAGGWQPTDFPPMVRASSVADDSGFPNCTERGFWFTATAYSLNDAAMNRGSAYVCTSAHTSGATTEPGVGASWATKWTLATELIWKDVEYPFTISAATAQRLAKIDLLAGRRMAVLAAPMKLTAYRAQPSDVIQLDHANFGWSGKTFEAQTSALTADTGNGGAPYLGVDVVARETDANVYAWSTADEQAMGASPTPNLADPSVVAAPTLLALVSGSATVLTRGDGIKLSRIQVTWTSPADQFVLSGGKIFVEYKKSADPTWLAGDEVDGATAISYLQGVNDGVSYDVRARARNVIGVYSAFITVTGHVVSSVVSNFTGTTNFAGQNMLDNPDFEIAASPGSGDVVAGWFVSGTSGGYTAAPETNPSLVENGNTALYLSAPVNTSIPAGTEILTQVQGRKTWVPKAGEIYVIKGRIRTDAIATLPAGLDRRAEIRARVTYSDGSITDYTTNRITTLTGAYVDVTGRFLVAAPGGGLRISSMVLFGYAAVGNTSGGAVSTPATLLWDVRYDRFTLVRVTSQDEQNMVATGNVNSAIRGANPLSTSLFGGAARISIAAFTAQFGFGTVPYNSGTIDGGPFSTAEFVRLLDPVFSGGAAPYSAVTAFEDIVTDLGYFFVGPIITCSAGGTGGGPPPTGGGGGCPEISQWLSDELQAGDAKAGDLAMCVDEEGNLSLEPIISVERKKCHCVLMEATDGSARIDSWDTPYTTKDGRSVLAINMIGGQVRTTDLKDSHWRGVKVRPVGMREVVRINLGGKTFAARNGKTGRYVFSHNYNKL